MGAMSGYYKVIPLTAIIVCFFAFVLFFSEANRPSSVPGIRFVVS